MAKITIQKKTDTNPYKNLSRILDIADLEVKFPKQWDEPWRRFDPARLLPSMTQSALKGFTYSQISANDLPKNIITLSTETDWRKNNELFLKKAKNNLEKFSELPAIDFFEDYLAKSRSPDHTYILRIAGFDTPASLEKSVAEVSLPTPTIEIRPFEIEKLARHTLYIYCEENSRSTINIVKQSALFDLSAVYVFQEKNSILRLRYLDENHDNISHSVAFFKSYQEKNSVCEIGIYHTSTKQNKKFFVENMLKENANVRYSGIFTGKFSHVDHDFLIQHQESYSKSDVLFKMAVLEESYGVFWGDTRIIPGTRGCEGYQHNKNMILGENARIDAIPRLRIQTEHVMAAHGSATGEISDDEIFYMMSRGLSYDEARKLLLRGFFEDVLRQSFGADPDISDSFLARIWRNIEKILGTNLSGQ